MNHQRQLKFSRFATTPTPRADETVARHAATLGAEVERQRAKRRRSTLNIKHLIN